MELEEIKKLIDQKRSYGWNNVDIVRNFFRDELKWFTVVNDDVMLVYYDQILIVFDHASYEFYKKEGL